MRRLLLLLLFSLPLFAAEAPVAGEEALRQELQRLDAIEEQLSAGRYDDVLLHQWHDQVLEVRKAANSCVDHYNAQLSSTDKALATLGDEVEGEQAIISSKRRELESEHQRVDKAQATCRFVLLRSDQLFETIAGAQQKVLATHLLARGETVEALIREGVPGLARWLLDLPTFLIERSGLERLRAVDLLLVLLLVGGAIWSMAPVRRWLRKEEGVTYEAFSAYFMVTLKGALARYFPLLAVSLGLFLSIGLLTINASPRPFIWHVVSALPLYAVGLSVIQLLQRSGSGPHGSLVIDEKLTRSLARRLKLLATLLLIAYVMLVALLEQGLSGSAFNLARGVFITLIIINLIGVIWQLGHIADETPLRWLRPLMVQALVIALLAEWLAYRNLSLYILQSFIGTLVAIGSLILLSRLFSELYDGLDVGEYGWQQRLRHWLAVPDGSTFPGLTWLRFFTSLVLWVTFLLAMMWTWDMTATGIDRLQVVLSEGFTLGSLNIVPSRLLLALLVMVLLFTFSSWLKGRLEQRWLLKTHMSRGAREALVTFSGYLGFSIALLIALGVTGVDFTSLALIAGALSVGIGFGLQNIVNNFVSGLILLIEQPIKTGDWIVVGSTEGHVKKISIRSTIIETFDRADVIVPNSELISGQVTNWMLRDTRGRVRVPVGVAYGSDVEKVRRILQEVAYANGQVITREESTRPKVLFLGFGDSSLDFELRCFIEEVDNRLNVLSDINFAIDRAFREEGVEIPFPQRDLHIRNWPAEPAQATPVRRPWRRGSE